MEAAEEGVRRAARRRRDEAVLDAIVMILCVGLYFLLSEKQKRVKVRRKGGERVWSSQWLCDWREELVSVVTQCKKAQFL